MGWKAVAGISASVLLGGLLLAGWVLTRFDLWPVSEPKTEAVTTINAANPKNEAAAATSDAAGTVVAKIEQLEDRISQIGLGSGVNAGSGRADAVVTALSVRRAIESGAALGITESQLRQRFGASHPKAVAAIQAAALAPVKLSDLRDALARDGYKMLTKDGDDSLWARFNLELSELVIIRDRGTPSNAPTQILQRAEQQISNGDIRGAIADIERLPKNAVQQKWVGEANRYLAARDALDVIERAALTAPAALPAPALPSLPPASVPAETNPPTISPTPEILNEATEPG
jgi:hypothetical protein